MRSPHSWRGSRYGSIGHAPMVFYDLPKLITIGILCGETGGVPGVQLVMSLVIAWLSKLWSCIMSNYAHDVRGRRDPQWNFLPCCTAPLFFRRHSFKKKKFAQPAATARRRHPDRSQGGSAGSHSRAYPAAFENSCELRVTRLCLLSTTPPAGGFQGFCLALISFLWGSKVFAFLSLPSIYPRVLRGQRDPY